VCDGILCIDADYMHFGKPEQSKYFFIAAQINYQPVIKLAWS